LFSIIIFTFTCVHVIAAASDAHHIV
jgi:hypothetical protein